MMQRLSATLLSVCALVLLPAGPAHAQDLAAAVKGACIDDHGKRLTPHSLRHGYGSMLIAAGRDVVRVSRRMGHASVAITLRVYSHEFESHRPEDDVRDLLALESFAPTNG